MYVCIVKQLKYKVLWRSGIIAFKTGTDSQMP